MALCANLKNQERSFTIIELLVVIAAIGLLIGIVLVATAGVRERAQLARTASWAATNHRVLGANSELVLNFEECRGVTNNATATPPFIDLSGNNNHSTCTGAECPRCLDGVPGVTGRALSFDGGSDNNDFVSVPNSGNLRNAFNTSINFTLNAWVFQRTENWSAIINNDTGSCWNATTNSIWLGDWRGFICVMGNGGTDSPCNPAGGSISIWNRQPLNTWHHVVCAADGTTLRMFVNGRQVGARLISDLTLPRISNNNPIVIGRKISHSGTFNGIIDDLRAYSEAMPLAYIQEQYLQGLQSLLANNAITEQEYNQRMTEFNKNLVSK